MSSQKPSIEKLLTGTYRSDRVGLNVKQDKDYKFPACPRQLKGAPRSIWREVQKEMTKYQLITGADKSLLEQYCYLLAKLRSDSDAFTASLHAQLRGLANDLCLSPESRSKANLQQHDPAQAMMDKYGV